MRQAGINVAQFTATASFNVEIRRVTQPAWKEYETNWNSFDCDADPLRALKWCAAGGDSTAVDSVTWTATGTGNQSLGIAPLVEKAVGKTGTRAPTSGQLHFLMKAAGDTSGGKRFLQVRSKEYTSFPPKLIVTWTPPPPSPSPWVSFRDETAQRLATSSCTELLPHDPVADNDRMEKDIAVADFDQDGDTDIVVVRRDPFLLELDTPTARRPLLFLNESGTLTERAGQFPAITASARDVAVGDFDGQNGPDIAIVTTCSDPPKFVRNRGGVGANWLGFEDHTASWKPTNGPFDGYTVQTSRYCGVAVGDVDRDSDIDIYMVNYVGNCAEEIGTPNRFKLSNRDVLLINRITGADGIGRFFDDTPARLGANARVVNFGTSAVIQDTNNDGFADLIKNDSRGLGTLIFPSSGPPDYSFTGVPVQVENTDGYHIVGGLLNGDSIPDLYVASDTLDRYYFGPMLTSDLFAQSVLGPGIRTVETSGNTKLGDLDGDSDMDVGVADVDQVFHDSCNVCNSENRCTLRCAGAECSPTAPSCAAPNHNQCIEENLNTKSCAFDTCTDSFTPAISCGEDADCQTRLFTLLRNTGGTLDEPWGSDVEQNFNLRAYDFDFADINSDGCLDLFLGTCSGYKLFIQNCP